MRAVREITRRCPPTKVVALSAHEDADTMIRMIGAGAGAYVPKSESTDEILRAIHRSVTHDGQKSSPTDAAEKVHRSLVERRDEQRARVEQALQSGAVTTAFQAIVELESGLVIGMEAQPRVAMLPSRPYDAWSADAEAVGLLEDLEVAALRSAVKALRRLPVDRFVEFEVSADTTMAAAFQKAISLAASARVVLAISDLSPVQPGLEEALAPLRDRGVRLCVNDVGADIDSLDRVVRLSPEFVRIDPALTNDVDSDPSRHAIVAAVAAWVTEAGAGSVAEQVVSEGQLTELGRLGVGYVQGPHLGPPRHLAELGKSGNRQASRSVKREPGHADILKRNVSPPGTPRETP